MHLCGSRARVVVLVTQGAGCAAQTYADIGITTKSANMDHAKRVIELEHGLRAKRVCARAWGPARTAPVCGVQ